MRNRAGGILIENGKMLLIHRIKEEDGIRKEYYVIPGGGIEGEEDLDVATKRELKEEAAIDVRLLKPEPIYTLVSTRGTQYFLLIERVAGEIRNGDGPEFNDASYANHGYYAIEMLPVADIISGKVNMVPDRIREAFIATINTLNRSVSDLNSKDLVETESVLVKEL